MQPWYTYVIIKGIGGYRIAEFEWGKQLLCMTLQDSVYLIGGDAQFNYGKCLLPLASHGIDDPKLQIYLAGTSLRINGHLDDAMIRVVNARGQIIKQFAKNTAMMQLLIWVTTQMVFTLSQFTAMVE
jgi:hypothetical protein